MNPQSTFRMMNDSLKRRTNFINKHLDPMTYHTCTYYNNSMPSYVLDSNGSIYLGLGLVIDEFQDEYFILKTQCDAQLLEKIDTDMKIPTIRVNSEIKKYLYDLFGDVALYICEYMSEPICTISVRGNGGIMFEKTIDKFPFTGFPQTLIPVCTLRYVDISINITSIYKEIIKPLIVKLYHSNVFIRKSDDFIQIIQNKIIIDGYNSYTDEGGGC